MRLLTVVVTLCFFGLFVDTALAVSIIGVDLGLEWFKVALVKPRVPVEIVLNAESKRKTPMFVSYDKNELAVGSPAMVVSQKNPGKAYGFFLELLGQDMDSEVVQAYQARFPHHTIEKATGGHGVVFRHDDEHVFSPVDLLAQILEFSRSMAEVTAEEPIGGAVLAVPPWFTPTQRVAVLEAAEVAGLKVLEIMDSNAAAALQFGVFSGIAPQIESGEVEKTYAFYDMGAGSTTASVVHFSRKSETEKEVMVTVESSASDDGLGGFMIDLRLRDLLSEKFMAKAEKKGWNLKQPVSENPKALAKLLKEANRVKTILSANQDTRAQVETLHEGEDFASKVSRAEMEELVEPTLRERVPAVLQEALEGAGYSEMSQLDGLIIVGGGTRVPKVQELLLEANGGRELGKNINADEATAMGACFRGAELSKAFLVRKVHVRQKLSDSVYRSESATNLEAIGNGGDLIANDDVVVFRASEDYRPVRRRISFKDIDGSSNEFAFVLFRETEDGGKAHVADITVTGLHKARDNFPDLSISAVNVTVDMDNGGFISIGDVVAVVEGEESYQVRVKKTVDDEPAAEEPEAATDEEAGADGDEKDEGAATEDGGAPDAEETTETAEEKTKSEYVMETRTREVTRKVTLKSQVSGQASVLGEDKEEAIARFEKIKQEQKERVANEGARNALEAFGYEIQGSVEEDMFVSCSTADLRDEIKQLASSALDWLYSDTGLSASTSELQERRQAIVEKVEPVKRLIAEHSTRPKAVELVNQLITMVRGWVSAMQAKAEEEKYHVEEELQGLLEKVTEVEDWMADGLKEQEEKDLSEEPVLSLKQFSSRMQELKSLWEKQEKKKPPKKPKVTQETPKDEEKAPEEPNSENPADEQPVMDGEDPNIRKDFDEDADIPDDFEEDTPDDEDNVREGDRAHLDDHDEL
eukprot:Clim_evm115s147 gene=Clim_evmTU115s147